MSSEMIGGLLLRARRSAAFRLRVQMAKLKGPKRGEIFAARAQQVATPEQIAVRELCTRFESIGENCEFGFLQRHFGAEPLGLLRMSGINLANLMRGLDERFAGVSEATQTNYAVNPANSEYYTDDLIYGINTHTLMTEDEYTREQVITQFSRRTNYLRDRLLEALGESEKTFVFQAREGLTDAKAYELHAAIRSYGGPCDLLCVRPQDADHPAGTVVRLPNGPLLGALDRVGLHDGVWNISYDVWRTILEKADAMRPVKAETHAAS